MAETGEEEVRALLPRVSTRKRSSSPSSSPIPGRKIAKVMVICLLMGFAAAGFAMSSFYQDSHSVMMKIWLWFSTFVAFLSLGLDIYDLYATGMDRLSCISFLFSSISAITCLAQLIRNGKGISPEFYPLAFAIVMCIASVFNLVVDKIIQCMRNLISNIFTSGSNRLGSARLSRSARLAAIGSGSSSGIRSGETSEAAHESGAGSGETSRASGSIEEV